VEETLWQFSLLESHRFNQLKEIVQWEVGFYDYSIHWENYSDAEMEDALQRHRRHIRFERSNP